MKLVDDTHVPGAGSPDEQAAEAFLRHRAGGSVPGQPPQAQRRVERAWQAVGDLASAPEIIAMRTQALERMRSSSARRGLRPAKRNSKWATAAAVAGLALGIAWQISPLGYAPSTYKTGIGEQRVIELDDHSRITLDSRTRVRVHFSPDTRVVQLSEGQAQFSVASDPKRPFTVLAGTHAIIALGTSFSVEYVDRQVRVAMIEGRVRVTVGSEASRTQQGAGAAQAARSTELVAGEALRVRADGAVTLIPVANVDAAMAWRQGKVIFDAEPLSEAVRRLNRYSRVQIEIDDSTLATLSISGMFEAGDSREFTHALQSYLPVAADYSESGVIHLRPAP